MKQMALIEATFTHAGQKDGEKDGEKPVATRLVMYPVDDLVELATKAKEMLSTTFKEPVVLGLQRFGLALVEEGEPVEVESAADKKKA